MPKSALKLTTLLGASLLTACVGISSATAPITPAADSFCQAARPIRLHVSSIEAMSLQPDKGVAESDLAQLKAHNCVGAKLCGWKQAECTP